MRCCAARTTDNERTMWPTAVQKVPCLPLHLFNSIKQTSPVQQDAAACSVACSVVCSSRLISSVLNSIMRVQILPSACMHTLARRDFFFFFFFWVKKMTSGKRERRERKSVSRQKKNPEKIQMKIDEHRYANVIES